MPGDRNRPSPTPGSPLDAHGRGAAGLYTPAFLLLACANLCTTASFGSFSLLPIFLSQKGCSESDIGILMGVMALAAVLCRPWTSEAIDRIGRKRSYTTGSALMTLVPLAYLGLSGDVRGHYVAFLLARLVHGVGLALCFTAVFTFAADFIPVRRLNEGLGMFGISGLSGLAIGPLVGELVIHRLGFPAFFLAASCLAGLGFILHLPVRDSSLPPFSGPHVSFFSILKRSKASTIALLALLFGIGQAASGNFVAPFAESDRIGFISLYYIAYSAAAILVRLMGGRLADRLGEATIIPYAMAVNGAGLFLMASLGGWGILLISGLLTGCGHGLLFPSLNAAVIRSEPLEIRGKLTGIFTGGIDAGAFFGAISLGYVGELAGFRVLFLAAGMALLMGVGVVRWKREVVWR